MTIYAQRFEIRRMISTMFGKLKDMMTMGLVIFNEIMAVLANTLIALVDVLLEPDPVANLRTPVPGKAHIGNFRDHKVISHALPNITSSDQSSPRRALPVLSFPHPNITLSCHAFHDRTRHQPILPRPTLTTKRSHTLTCRTQHHLVTPYLITPLPYHKVTYEPQNA
jgi:hypothetical protein